MKMDYLEHYTLAKMLSDVVKDLDFVREAILAHNVEESTVHGGTANEDPHQRTGEWFFVVCLVGVQFWDKV